MARAVNLAFRTGFKARLKARETTLRERVQDGVIEETARDGFTSYGSLPCPLQRTPVLISGGARFTAIR
jgi:hypothetical protein